MTTIAALNVPTLLARSTTAKRDVRTNAFFQKKVTGVAAAVPRAGQKYANVAAAVDAGLIQGVAPFPEGIDVFGFFNDIDQAEAQRYADVEITHGRLAMLASVGFLVGESVEGSSFLFDSQVTGPAINHFQQVPLPFWLGLGALIFIVEASRVQIAWQSPFDASRLGLMKDDHTPGDYGAFDPLGLSKGKDEEWLDIHRLRELNNGRLAMVAITAMVAQELNTGINLVLADEVLGIKGGGALKAMEASCAGSLDEAACSKAFEAAVAAGTAVL
uniref:Chlorophyll a-b binding protein, chloroplastic n=1 Tax=Micromonas pusilla TaxID=38833 RepID=A4QPP0_MICPS|nr:TPA_inf: chloroplast light-harvesting complex protein precursor LI818;1 [Micromonas pusilla]